MAPRKPRHDPGPFARPSFDIEDPASYFDPFTHQGQSKVRLLINRIGRETDAVVHHCESQNPILIANTNCDL
jgi:hypothetical protein